MEKCERNLNLSKKVNFEYQKIFLLSMKGLNKKTKLIHISTDQVYSKIKFPFKNKRSRCKAYKCVWKNKAKGERLVQKKHIVLRTNTLVKQEKIKNFYAIGFLIQ